jgi:FdhE protein
MNFEPSAIRQDIFEETVAVIHPAPARIFEQRASRLRSLAPGHAVSDYLDAMAWLARAQLSASQAPILAEEQAPPPALPFDVCTHHYGEACEKILEIIVSEMQMAPLPEPSHAALSRLSAATPGEIESAAHAILSGSLDGIDLAAASFLCAALQVYWTRMASIIPAETAGKVSRRCPVCGSAPVAGIILSSRKLRYLCCSLCATHWYFPRLTCSNCGSVERLSYFTTGKDAKGTKAETCNQCNTYLKLFYLEHTAEADAFADDLATIALDLMMGEGGYRRGGVNLFLLQK